MDLGVEGEGAMREKVRRTRGESSVSTERAERAAEARRAVGRGMSRVSVQGNSSSVDIFGDVWSLGFGVRLLDCWIVDCGLWIV